MFPFTEKIIIQSALNIPNFLAIMIPFSIIFYLTTITPKILSLVNNIFLSFQMTFVTPGEQISFANSTKDLTCLS